MNGETLSKVLKKFSGCLCTRAVASVTGVPTGDYAIHEWVGDTLISFAFMQRYVVWRNNGLTAGHAILKDQTVSNRNLKQYAENHLYDHFSGLHPGVSEKIHADSVEYLVGLAYHFHPGLGLSLAREIIDEVNPHGTTYSQVFNTELENHNEEAPYGE